MMAESLKRLCLQQIIRTNRFPIECNQEKELITHSQMISFIAQVEEVKIDVNVQVKRETNYKVCSDFSNSLISEGKSSKKVYTISGEKLKELNCTVEVYI